jgi:hypothetical protein
LNIAGAIIAAKESSMTKWWHVSWKRVGIALLVVFGALWLLAGIGIGISNQLEPWLLTRSLFRDNPNLSIVPAVLPDQSVAPLSGMIVQTYGFSFQTPWNESAKVKNGKSVYLLAFPEGGVGVLVFNPSRAFESARMMRDDPRKAQILGEKTVHSSYDLMAAEMWTKPEQVKWWNPPTQNARYSILLSMKSMELGDDGAVYAVNFGQVRGFQEGNPAVPPYRVHLDLFDAADHHYEIQIAVQNDSRSVLTQAQVNAMVASLRPIPQS